MVVWIDLARIEEGLRVEAKFQGDLYPPVFTKGQNLCLLIPDSLSISDSTISVV